MVYWTATSFADKHWESSSLQPQQRASSAPHGNQYTQLAVTAVRLNRSKRRGKKKGGDVGGEVLWRAGCQCTFLWCSFEWRAAECSPWKKSAVSSGAQTKLPERSQGWSNRIHDEVCLGRGLAQGQDLLLFLELIVWPLVPSFGVTVGWLGVHCGCVPS